ncbi:MAG: Bax inhibitor-1/YccA family protein [Marmoricola sp.]
MQSRNPVFTRAAGFNGKAGSGGNHYGNQTYPGNGRSYAGYGDPSTWSVGSPGTPTHTTPGGGVGLSTEGPMTVDSVVQKTGLTLVIVVLAAAATWLLTGNPGRLGSPVGNAAGTLYTLALVGALGGFVLAMVNSFKRVVSPPLVLGYAVLEGVFIGAMSKVFDASFGHGVIIGAVLGTFAAVAGTLAAYRFFNIRVSARFRKFVVAAMFGFVAVSMLDLVLGFFGSSFGFNGLGGIGFVASLVGLGLGVLMLILDFDFIERGVAAGLPERESWRAAFGLTVTIVWIYIELLRILAILNRS